MNDHPLFAFQNDSHPAKPLKHAPGVKIFYEDQDILIVEKPSGLLSVPTEKKEPKTLFGILKRYLIIKHRQKGFTQPVQRLDRGTSGVMVWPKTQPAWQHLRDQFEKHTIQRVYVGIVKGNLKEPRATLRNYLATDRKFNQIVSDSTGNGEEAITHYRVLREEPDATFIEFTLETGRKNQIRAQMAHIGHPILGDDRYSPQMAKHPRWNFKRLALHAATLEFRHPARQKILKFQSKLPREFLEFCTSSP